MENREKLNLIVNRSKHYLSEDRIKKIFNSKYNEEAINFLLETKTQCEIVSKGLSYPSWQNKNQVNTYEVTLKNSKGSYTFTFYDSIKNTEDRKPITFDFYSVLACLELYTPESFDEFCSDYGYEFKNERDYIHAKQVHSACLDQCKALRKLFTSEELEKLAEIR